MLKHLLKEKEFNDLVMEWNKKINLVSRKKTDVYDLIDDSRIYLEYIDFTKSPKILDIGTGGGFPGIVIKIHQPESRIILLDSIIKKITAVCDIISRLGLKRINAICIRAEDLAKNNMFKHTFDYVVARSVAPLNELIKWSSGLIKPKGKLITLKGGNIEKEINRTLNIKYIKNVKVFDREDKKIVIVEYFLG